jgi:hypothetical protein
MVGLHRRVPPADELVLFAELGLDGIVQDRPLMQPGCERDDGVEFGLR